MRSVAEFEVDGNARQIYVRFLNHGNVAYVKRYGAKRTLGDRQQNIELAPAIDKSRALRSGRRKVIRAFVNGDLVNYIRQDRHSCRAVGIGYGDVLIHQPRAVARGRNDVYPVQFQRSAAVKFGLRSRSKARPGDGHGNRFVYRYVESIGQSISKRVALGNFVICIDERYRLNSADGSVVTRIAQRARL